MKRSDHLMRKALSPLKPFSPTAKKIRKEVGPGESSSKHTRRQVDFSSSLEQAASSNPTMDEHIIDETHTEVDITDERNEEYRQNVAGAIDENEGDENEGETILGDGDDNEDEGENTESSGREIGGEESTPVQEDQEEIVVTTQTEGSKQNKNKVDIFGKILETSTPQAFLDRIGVKFRSSPPRVPLCRMIQTEAIRKVSPSTDKSLTRSFKKLGGYIESMGAFTVSIMDLEGEETPLTQEREESWDEHWRTVNQQFEESLSLDPEWGPYLSQKMVHILDGNNRHNAWMECISTGYQGDLTMHCCVLCKFYEFERRDVGELMFSLSRLNKTHDYAFVPTTFGDRLFQLRRLGESDLTTLMAHLDNEDKLWVQREMQSVSIRGRPNWFQLPIQIMTWLLFKDEMEQKIDEASKGPLAASTRENVTRKIEVLYRGKTAKYARIADPSNGEAFWCAVLSLPWHASTNHVATEEKLNMIGTACIRDTDKAHIVKLLDNSQAAVRSLVEGMPTDKKKIREWLHMYSYWLQIIELGLRIQNDIKNADRVKLPSEGRFSSFVVLCRRKYFKRAFKAHEGGIKFTHDVDHQPGLQNAAQRVVYRWLLTEIEEHQLDILPPLASVWLCVDNQAYMYADLKLGRAMSSIETRFCPWWLDLERNHVPEEELDLHRQHKSILELRSQQIDHNEATSTSHATSIASASFRKSLPVNLGREIVNRALEVNRAMEVHREQSQQQTSNSCGGGTQPTDIITKTLQAPGTIYAFNVSIEDLASAFMNIDDASSVGKQVLEAMNVICTVGNVKNRGSDYCVELIFADFPSNIIIEGCVANKVPYWNKIGDDMYGSTFQVVDSCLSDRGFFTCLYTMEEGVTIEQVAHSVGFGIYHRQVVRCTPPIGKKMGQKITTQVTCLILAVFVRSTTPTTSFLMHGDQLRDLALGDDLDVGQDLIFDIVPSDDLVKRKGRPWRGGCQRGQRLCKYIVSVFSRPGDTVLDMFAGTGTLGLVAAFMDRNVIMLDKDERIYDHLLEPYSAKL